MRDCFISHDNLRLLLLIPVYPYETTVSEIARAAGRNGKDISRMIINLPAYFPIAERPGASENYFSFPDAASKKMAFKGVFNV